MTKLVRVLSGSLVAALAAGSLAACSNGGSAAGQQSSESGSVPSASEAVTVNWWTWDDKQAESYKKCVTPFEKANQNITVNISQYGWGDYWPKLTAGFLAGNAPDAFQNNAGYYPEFVSQGQLLPLDDLIAADGVDMGQYASGTQTWKYTDGKFYGLPMDWSTVGLYYNSDMLEQAGLTADDMANLTWNPDDGGTFEKVVAHLTIDENGVRGDEAGFDKTKVKVYGISNQGSSNVNGGDTWAQFAGTTGWTLGNTPNWPTTFQYSDPRFEATASYLRGLADKGYSPQMGQFTLGNSEQLGSASVAMVSDGSWMATTYAALPDIKVGIAPSVIGPNGDRSALSNSNGNSIWAGSKNTDAAWKWVSYMESEECQTLAGVDGTFFSAIPAAMDATAAAMKQQGIDISPFTDRLTDGSLFESPMYAHGQEVDAAVTPLLEAYFTHQQNEEAFTAADAASKEILAK